MNSPLYPWHEQAGAEFQDYAGVTIVSTYGRLPLEYAAMYRSAAIVDMAQRGVIAISGADRISFLNSILTAELVARDSGRTIATGEVRFTFLLDRKGRVLAEMNVFAAADRVLLEMDRRLVDVVAKELEKYHFREQVTIAFEEGLAVLAVIGPGAEKLLGEQLGEASADAGAMRWRMDLGPAVAFTMLVTAAELPAVWEKLAADAKQVVAAGWAAYNAVRIEAGRGLFGIDYDETFLPAETGQLERAVSFIKGCYPGQEIVARMHSRGQYARKLLQLRVEGEALPLAGALVCDDDGNEIGVVTSSTISPRNSGMAMALAILKREAIDRGLPVKLPAEGAMRVARVI